MTTGYIDAPELTRATFIDGWYQTNDFGFQPSDGKLVVLGRADDMLNVGGVKIAPGPIEDRLRAIDGVRDALVTNTEDGLKSGILLAAVEIGPDCDSAYCRRQLSSIIGEYTIDFETILLSAFPRTETGKVRRDRIREDWRRNPTGSSLCQDTSAGDPAIRLARHAYT